MNNNELPKRIFVATSEVQYLNRHDSSPALLWAHNNEHNDNYTGYFHESELFAALEKLADAEFRLEQHRLALHADDDLDQLSLDDMRHISSSRAIDALDKWRKTDAYERIKERVTDHDTIISRAFLNGFFEAVCVIMDNHKRRKVWHDIPTDKDGFGDYEQVPFPCLLLYNDSEYYIYDDSAFSGELERHPDRYKWAYLPKRRIKGRNNRTDSEITDTITND